MEPPLKPSESDCCNSGCNPCILDVYEEQLEKYNRAIATEVLSKKKNCISPTTYTVFKVVRIVEHTHDTLLFTFEYVKRHNDSTDLNTDELALICKPGHHFMLKGVSPYDKNTQFTKAYTPIPINNKQPLTFTIIAKLYPQGEMSRCLEKLALNSETLWRGPYGSFEISLKFRYVLLIAQGTGIAPLFAVLNEMLYDPDCDTFVKLFFCCRTSRDILFRNELYELSGFWNFNYEIFLTSGEEDVKCKYNEIIHSSHLDHNAIKGYVEDKCERRNLQVLVCGSEMFNNDIMKETVSCGVDANNIFHF